MHEWKQECTHLDERGGSCLYWDGICCVSEYPGGCLPIVGECKTGGKDGKACVRIIGEVCSVYIDPKKRWAVGRCPLIEKEQVEETAKKINPLKASKRASAGKKKG